MGDLKSFLARYFALRQSMIDDGTQRGLSIHEKDLRSILERVKTEGTSFAKVTLPLLGKALDSALVSGHLIVPANFSRRKKSALPSLLYGLFRDIFDEEGCLLQEPNIEAIRFLRQFLLIDGKLFAEPTPEQEKVAVYDFFVVWRRTGRFVSLTLKIVYYEQHNSCLETCSRRSTYQRFNLAMGQVVLPKGETGMHAGILPLGLLRLRDIIHMERTALTP
jgi:hypothetical protein